MALDTREKRANSLGVGRIWMRGARVAVGTSDEQARIATGLGYGGNALTPGVAASGALWYYYMMVTKNDGVENV